VRDRDRRRGSGAPPLDICGATAKPGIVNGHPHMLHMAATQAALVDLFNARNHDDIVDRIRTRAAPPPPPPPPPGGARLWLVLDRRRSMREGRAAGVPWGDGGLALQPHLAENLL
jgi:predicted amidohydrolase YtcJ